MVSVILRSRNEERYVGFAIQSLHDFFGYDLEIVLVDNESTDNTIRVVNSFEYLNIKKIIEYMQAYINCEMVFRGPLVVDLVTVIQTYNSFHPGILR